ncbi:YceI family protein [Flavobacteriales bacterium]|nr:YceI family protein [Flavobacteriales bacterium]MDC3337985.1 YceI family protein [Flavobacteriales bacterium]
MKTALIAMALLLSGTKFNAQKLNVDVENTRVEFVFTGDQTKGTVSGMQCEITFDLKDLKNSKIVGTIDASTLNTGNGGRDKHLHSADFFDVKKFPLMKFESTEFVSMENDFKVVGNLTIKNMVEVCSIRFTYKEGVFKGETSIDAKKYGVSPGKKDGNVDIVFTIPVIQ